jgi:hypothetical protein
MKHEHLDDTNDPRKDPREEAIDDALGQALRAEDPGAAFTQRVLARAREERAAQQAGRPLHAIGTSGAAASSRMSADASSEVSADAFARVASNASNESPGAAALDPSRGESGTPRVRVRRFTATRKLIAAVAASLTLAAVGVQYLQHRRYVEEGERARAQVLAALRLTNQKLNIVHDQITEREGAR